MTSQENLVTSLVRGITFKVNKEVGPQVPQQANTMTSHLEDKTRMNPRMSFGWMLY